MTHASRICSRVPLLLLVCLILPPSLVASDDPYVADREAAVRDGWHPDTFTDPGRHSPTQFRYLVHMAEFAFLVANRTPAEVYRYLTQEVAPCPCLTLSTSLIDQDHRRTYGGLGFIVRVPADNILAANHADIGSAVTPTGKDPLKFAALEDNLQILFGPLRTPDQILHDTNPSSFNEVVVVGKKKDPIAVTGILIRPASGKQSPDQAARRGKAETALRQLARQEKLPVVELP